MQSMPHKNRLKEIKYEAKEYFGPLRSPKSRGSLRSGDEKNQGAAGK